MVTPIYKGKGDKDTKDTPSNYRPIALGHLISLYKQTYDILPIVQGIYICNLTNLIYIF